MIELITRNRPHIGLFTRPVALMGSVYLLMSMLWARTLSDRLCMGVAGRRLRIRRVLGRYDPVFAVLGGGPLSVDNAIRQSDFSKPVAAAAGGAPSVPVWPACFEQPHGGLSPGHWDSRSCSRLHPPFRRARYVWRPHRWPSEREGIDADALEHAAAQFMATVLRSPSRLNHG